MKITVLMLELMIHKFGDDNDDDADNDACVRKKDTSRFTLLTVLLRNFF